MRKTNAERVSWRFYLVFLNMASITSTACAPVKAVTRAREKATPRIGAAQVALEAERQIGKPTSHVVSVGHFWNSIIFWLFVVVAVVAITNCFFQLLRLLSDDSIKDVVRFLLRRAF